MESTYKKAADGTVTITTFKPEGDLMDQETALQIGLHEAGRLAMLEAIKDLDTDGRPIVISNEGYTSRGAEKNISNDLRGCSSSASGLSVFSGGKTIVPLESKGGFLGSSYTPKFSKMVSWKYSQMSARQVCEDLGMNHAKHLSTKLVQSTSAHVEDIAMDKEFEWHYDLPVFTQVVHHISIGRDGTTTAIRGEGYRETMCGTISFYNSDGERLHTIYSVCAPEFGKKTFDSVLNMEIEQVKAVFPSVTYVGLTDGQRIAGLFC